MDATSLKLIYRGHIYNYTPRPVQPYRKPHALNWRWQTPGENYKSTDRPILPYCPPRALNWRFQISAGMQFQ